MVAKLTGSGDERRGLVQCAAPSCLLSTPESHPGRGRKSGAMQDSEGTRSPPLPFLLVASAQEAGGEAKGQGQDAELGDAWGLGEDCREQCQQLRQPEVPLSIGSP